MLSILALASVASFTGTATAAAQPPLELPRAEVLAAPRTARRYAVVLGVNKPARSDQRPLRYADDDAVRFYEVFRQLSGEAALFALLDDETQHMFPEVVAEAELPSKKLLFERLDRMFEQIAADRARGLSTELYLVYSGHGYVDERGEGRLGLEDGTLTRTELYEEILGKSPAHVNHVIVDACDAYFFVQSRGDDPKVEALLNARAREFLDRQTLARFPNTGAILSTASAAETHEWSEIRGGVFSHEVRSALLGAADADQNGAISYDELEAFVLAANLGVRHAGASRAVFVRAPVRDRLHPVIELAALPRAHRLTIGPEISGRIAVADEQGRRYVDLNKAPGFSLAVRLLPGIRYFVRLGDLDYPVPGGEPEVELGSIAAVVPATAARGAGIAAAYARGLFAVPFGPQLVDGFRLGVSAQEVSVAIAPESHPLRTAGWVTGGAALVAGGLATTFYLLGDSAYDEYQRADRAQLPALSREVEAWDARTNVALGAAISLGVTAGAMFLLDAAGVSF